MASTAYLLSLRKFKCFNVHIVFGRERCEQAAQLLVKLRGANLDGAEG